MVAKGFLAAAAIIICCSTTLRGNDTDEKCASGDCPAASSDKQACSAEGNCCAEGKCDDKEECCEKERVVVLVRAPEKCSAEKCSTEKCSAEKCSTGECDKSKCSTEKCSTDLKCSKEKCSAEKCTAGQCSAEKCSGEKCTFSACAGGACDALKCALDGSAKSACAAEETCAKSKCSTETCAASNCAEGQCGAQSCPVAACAGQVCDALKCALQSCSTASDDDCCLDAVCATGACGTTQCATLQGGGQDCPAGECSGARCSDEVCDGLKCAVGLSLTSSGGQLIFTATKSFAGEPAPANCSTEACAEKTCSTEKCGTEKCATSTCSTSPCSTSPCSTSPSSTSNCASAKCSTEVCTAGTCSKAKCAAEKCSIETCSETACTAGECSPGKCGKMACATTECAAGVGELETKLAQLEQLQRDILALRAPAPNAEMYVVNVKMVELNRTRCRTLGWDLEVADGCTTNEFANQTCAALEKRKLAKVLCNPTLCVTSDRPASLAVGVEIPRENGDGQSVSEFIGTKLDVTASALPGNKVRLRIAPLISELCSSDQQPRRTKILKCDCVLDATLGKSFVMKGITENRVCSTTVEGRGPVEEVEEIQSFMLITVDRAENIDPQAAVRHAAYEKTLVETVQEPEFLTKVYPVPDLQVWKVRPQGVQFDADLLVAHLKSTVDPQSWRGAVCSSPADAEHANGAIQPFERNGSLVICQTEENHEQIANLLQKMRADGQEEAAAREEHELLDGGVTPASAESPVEQDGKCTQGECSESKCNGSKCQGAKCSKSEVSTTTAPVAECNGKCHGESPETASCPCIGGTCTR